MARCLNDREDSAMTSRVMSRLQQISYLSVFLLSAVLVGSINANEDFEAGEGLQVTLSSSEPDIVSLSNIDIDHRGSDWALSLIPP